MAQNASTIREITLTCAHRFSLLSPLLSSIVIYPFLQSLEFLIRSFDEIEERLFLRSNSPADGGAELFLCPLISISFYLVDLRWRWIGREGVGGMSSSGVFLDVQPSELKFPLELKKQSSCSMQLANKTDEYVAFKVKTTNPKKYCVRPNAGVVLPRATCDIIITMQAQKEVLPDMQCKDKFLLQSAVTEKGTATKDVTSEMFNKQPGKVVDDFKLRVVYVPTNRPSPVPEEAEEESSPRSSEPESGAWTSPAFESMSRSYEKPIKEKTSEALPVIAKLTEEKDMAIQQNQKLRQELDLLKKERNKHRSGFSVTFVALVGLLCAVIGYMLNRT